MLVQSPQVLAKLIKDQRKKLKLSQAEVGDLVGLKQKTISAIENNPDSVKISTLYRVLSALKLDIRISAKQAPNTATKLWSEEW